MKDLFLLQNLCSGHDTEEPLYLCGPGDDTSTDVTLQSLVFDECGKISKCQLWSYGSSTEDSFPELIENASSGFLDIDWNFAGTGEYSGTGAPVLAWPKAHGGKNQRFYLASFRLGKEEFSMIGRSADREEGFDKDATFLTANPGGIKMVKGSLEKPLPTQKWRLLPLEKVVFDPCELYVRWKEWEDDKPIPESVLVAGNDGSNNVYVALGTYGETEYIGKLQDRSVSYYGKVGAHCYIAKDGDELELKSYKILCLTPGCEASWKDVDELTEEDKKFRVKVKDNQFVGRATISGNVTPGRFEEDDEELQERSLYVPYGGYNETKSFEVLLVKKCN